MNAILENILKQAEAWPQEDQDELAAYAREIEARRTGFYVLSADEKDAVEEGVRQAECGMFVPDAEVTEADKRHKQ